MQIKYKALLSFYREIDHFNDHPNISIVQHIETKKIYVKKILSIYDINLYFILKKLQFPGIPKILMIVEDGDDLIIIEEYISGDSLEDYLNKNGPLDLDTSITLMDRLCNILNNLHSLDPPIIHRDLTPSNIMISYDMNVTLIDFNASKLFKSNKNRDTIPLGTVDYAAPEQYGFSQSDARTDVYALGIILNTMLTGSTPKYRIYHNRKISAIIAKCISIDPDKRYKSVRKFQKALKRANRKHSKSPPFIAKLKSLRFSTAIIICLSAILTFLFHYENTDNLSFNSMLRIYSTFTFITLIILSLRYADMIKHFPLIKTTSILVKITGILLLYNTILTVTLLFLI